MKTETMILTPVVARALEDRRRELDSDLDPRRFLLELNELRGVSNATQVATAAINRFKSQCAELGALDQVCAQHGITEFVMSERGEE